jgi:hypothetical protein
MVSPWPSTVDSGPMVTAFNVGPNGFGVVGVIAWNMLSRMDVSVEMDGFRQQYRITVSLTPGHPATTAQT